jgi:hypothetical protein
MARRISMATRTELVAAIRERYLTSTRAGRTAILDEFVAITGYHRKHAIRLLAAAAGRRAARRRPGRRRYGEEVRQALTVLWEASDRVCSKRLKPMILVLLPALERHGTLRPDEDTRAALLKISPATIDRLLSETRIAAQGGRRRPAGFSSAVRRSVPVRTFGDWNDPPPGFVEVDFVAHCGGSAAGSFVQTLVLTDIATGWTECVPVLVRSGELVIEALEKAKTLFPFPLAGVDFDNDGSFMNEGVVGWCRGHDLEVTRSRAYRKNDQAWVEQKNGALVRRLVGYGRFEGMEAAGALARLYAASRLHTNLFQPSFKLREKTRIGARVVKRWHPPLTPAARALASGGVGEADKAALRDLLARSDPVALLLDIRAAQAELGRRVDRRGRDPGPTVPDSAAHLTAAERTLQAVSRQGEQRPIHRRPYRRTKPVPVRPSMLDPLRDGIEAWLRAEPALSAPAVLARLREIAPERFEAKHLRTVQRFVKSWRAEQARRIIRLEALAIALPGEADDVAPDPSPTWVHRDLPRLAASDS